MNCWEFKGCGPELLQACPAYPDKGRSCWKKHDTMCDGGRLKMASVAERVEFCRRCGFYVKYADKF